MQSDFYNKLCGKNKRQNVVAMHKNMQTPKDSSECFCLIFAYINVVNQIFFA